MTKSKKPKTSKLDYENIYNQYKTLLGEYVQLAQMLEVECGIRAQLAARVIELEEGLQIQASTGQEIVPISAPTRRRRAAGG